MFSRYEALCRENAYAIRDLGALGVLSAFAIRCRCSAAARHEMSDGVSNTKGDTGLLIAEFCRSCARSVARRTWLSSEQALHVGVSQRDTSTRKPREYNTRDHDVWGLFGHIWGTLGWISGRLCRPPLSSSVVALSPGKNVSFRRQKQKAFLFPLTTRAYLTSPKALRNFFVVFISFHSCTIPPSLFSLRLIIFVLSAPLLYILFRTSPDAPRSGI